MRKYSKIKEEKTLTVFMSEKTNGNEIPSEDKVGMRTLMVTLSSLLFNHEEC
jgi:hypothetical protein